MTTTTIRKSTSNFLVNAVTAPPMDRASRIDTQQLWTFPHERDDTRRVRELSVSSQHELKGALLSYLTRSRDTYGRASEWSAGQIVWVELIALSEEELSDILVIRRLLGDRAADRFDSGVMRLPCMILATSEAADSDRRGVFPLITVVPLVHAPDFQADCPSNPTVTAESDKRVLTCLTQLLLTVDYSDTTRVYLECNGEQSWRATSAEYQAILNWVQKHLGL